MATSVFFNNFASSQEQLLIENLIVESIKIYGHDVLYLPKRLGNKDEIFGEAPSSFFNASYLIEMYIKSVDGFTGDGTLFSKFNLEIRDRVTFTVTRRVFSEEISTTEAFQRPREGDLIYFPLNGKIFEIKYVDNFSMFYQLGALQVWDIECELYEYSNERFDTGIPEVDQVQDLYSTALVDGSALVDDSGVTLSDINLNAVESTIDNDDLQSESDGFIDFSERDPFSEGQL